MKEKIGVYICHCGGNISDYVDVEELGKMLAEENGVVISKDVMFACADSNQKEMVEIVTAYPNAKIIFAHIGRAYYLKNVVPQWSLAMIYRGMADYMVIQVIVLVLMLLFPQISLWLVHAVR